MDSEKLCDTLREMLPAGVCVAAGPPIAMSLTAREQASLGPADAKRVREFESGRAYAKRALAMLGMHNVDLPIGPNRAPLWPSGVVGSITHVIDSRYGTYAAAAVARADACAGGGNRFRNGRWPSSSPLASDPDRARAGANTFISCRNSSYRGAVYLVCKGSHGENRGAAI